MEASRVEEGDMLSVDMDGAPLIGADASLAAVRHSAWRRRTVLGAMLGVGAVLATTALLAGTRPADGAALKGDAKAEVGLFAPLAAAAMVAEGLSGGATAVHYLPMMKKGLAKMEAPFKKVEREVLNSRPLNLSKYANLSASENIPKESLHDGNTCPDDEEVFGGLCYKKCSALTGGEYKIRTTAWSCCKTRPCTFFNSKFTNPLSLCEGFDVSGSKACPHPEGACLVNEEFNLGMCFKKCALLTEDKFPFRSAASTCCRYNSHWACLDAMNTQTSPDFNVGGGGSDGNPDTPASMHRPMPQFAEA